MKRASPSARFARERTVHYRLISRIYRLCNSGRWSLRYARLHRNASACESAGLIDESGGVKWTSVGTVDMLRDIIIVDYRAEVISTFVHECLHVFLDERFADTQHEAEEREVQRLERLMMRHLSPIQAKRLHTHMARMLHLKPDEDAD